MAVSHRELESGRAPVLYAKVILEGWAGHDQRAALAVGTTLASRPAEAHLDVVFHFLAVVQGAALLLLLVRLWPGRSRLPAVKPVLDDTRTGLVSIIVATLDEAQRIAPCLEGLLAQGPLVREIIIVDSGSLDGTETLVREAMATDHRVRLLRDDPLPSGWVGKVWALQHGLQHASAEWVLGIDADTAPHPGLSGGALAAAETQQYDAVSFAPRFQISSAVERWLQPALLTTLV